MPQHQLLLMHHGVTRHHMHKHLAHPHPHTTHTHTHTDTRTPTPTHPHTPTHSHTYVGLPEGLGVVSLVEEVKGQCHVGHHLQHPVTSYQRTWRKKTGAVICSILWKEEKRYSLLPSLPPSLSLSLSHPPSLSLCVFYTPQVLVAMDIKLNSLLLESAFSFCLNS